MQPPPSRHRRAPLLDDAGVVAAIENLAMKLNCTQKPTIECDSNVDFGRLQPVLKDAIYRIVQESLTNAVRHSDCDRIEVRLFQREDWLKIEVQDWGNGFDPGAVREGCFGLENIRERSRLLGGQSEVQNQPGQGTLVRVRLAILPRGPD